MTQTLALLLDAYRELNAKKLFWITLVLSALFIAAFALIGFNERGLTLAGYQFVFPLAASIYKELFSDIIIGFWLTWVSMILALVSTAGIFPDLITNGTIDLYLSRPISRVRLFLTKYFCGLLFVAIQVLVIALGGFLVMGLRGKVWMPSIFFAIPLVLLLFSYLYAVCVLLGIWTRSTITALLLTILAWALFAAAQVAEEGTFTWQRTNERHVEEAQRTIRDADAQLAGYEKTPSSDLMGVKAAFARAQRQHAENLLPTLEHDVKLPQLLHRVAFGLRVAVPKTRETTALLDRWLLTDAEALARPQRRERRLEERGRTEEEQRVEAAMDVQSIQRHRPVFWILGTSLTDEVLILALAGWIFCRRDY